MVALPAIGRRSLTLVFFFTVVSITFVSYYLTFGLPHTARHALSSARLPSFANWLPQKSHPIDKLLQEAQEHFDFLRSKESKDLESAVRAYRLRRGRHPPPEFDRWFQYAQAHHAIVVEEYFDQIYHDLNPFWALEPEMIRRSAGSWPHIISVRDGTVTSRSEDDITGRVGTWRDMVSQLAELLPDVDMAINNMDEPRLSVPWETINQYIKASNTLLNDSLELDLATALPTYSSLLPFPEGDERLEYDGHSWHSGPFWNAVRQTCDPSSSARRTTIDEDLSAPPVFTYGWPSASAMGFVANWTHSKNVCYHSHLRNLHGTFIEPISMSTDTRLMPIFGDSKLPNNNDILLPAAHYWTENVEDHRTVGWKQKKDAIVWRGDASGGRHKENTWTHYHRHRFVAMNNGSWIDVMQLEDLVRGDDPFVKSAIPRPFTLPSKEAYPLLVTDEQELGSWITEHADVAFLRQLCFPAPQDNSERCPYVDPYYQIVESMWGDDEFDYKYLPDIDGGSYSDRFRGLLYSNSLPLKATIFSEWHDDRLVPWLHFVPMDNTFVDYYSLLEYFIGFVSGGKRKRGHDKVALRLATEGQQWTMAALRKEDMLIYVYRLILEYARLCDDERDRMAYVDDLVDN